MVLKFKNHQNSYKNQALCKSSNVDNKTYNPGEQHQREELTIGLRPAWGVNERRKLSVVDMHPYSGQKERLLDLFQVQRVVR